MRWFMVGILLFTLIGCNPGALAPDGPSRSSERVLDDIELLATCAPLPDGCAADGFDTSRCVADDDLVVADAIDGVVVDVRVDPVAVADLHLPPGRYWTSVPDPTGGCDRTVVQVVVPQPVEVD